MKKIITSASLAALGVASVQAAYAPGLSPQERSKLWTISATLRGFYDDNYLTQTKTQKRDSWGLELSPSLGVNIALDQTLIGFSYQYGMRYYEDRQKNSADHSHQIDFKLNHAFTERYKLSVTDNFVAAQEPQIIDPSGVTTTPLRTEGNNIRNTARIAFDAEVTPILELGVAYGNTVYDYDQRGPGSRSALLDRVEHLPELNARWKVMPNTVGLLGYQYSIVNHGSNDSLDQNTQFGAPFVDPEVRDSTSHFVFVGVDRTFTSQLSGQARVGAQFTDYPDALPGSPDSSTGPYADANATWKYNPGSYLQLGVKHMRNQTDVAFTFSGTPTLDQESTSVYGVINHRLAPRLAGSFLGQYQHSTFKGGNADGEVDHLVMAGVNFSYQVNAFLSADAGYNYDRLDSDLAGRSYTRNRVYLGLRASY